MMKHFWALSKGEYADYCVVAIFEDYETAKKWQIEGNKNKEYDKFNEPEKICFFPSGTEYEINTVYVVTDMGQSRIFTAYPYEDIQYGIKCNGTEAWGRTMEEALEYITEAKLRK